MQSETKNCQNCKKDFTIEPEDFSFYEKIKVPPPTFCLDCRTIRRLCWRNEMSLFKRKCNAPGHEENMISMYPPEEALAVYDAKYWWGDDWDSLSYGKEYDFSKSFFEQWRDLYLRFPLQNLSNTHATNSDYCNVAEESRDSYMSSGSWNIERTLYSNRIEKIKDSSDLYVVHRSEMCYEDIHCVDSYKLLFSQNCKSCVDSYFLYDCHGCTSCFGCTNLRNKSYCMWNEQLSREEYNKRLSEMDLTSFQTLSSIKNKFEDMKTNAIHRFCNQVRTTDSTGDHIEGTRNCVFCFDTAGDVENCKNLHWALQIKDSHDCGPGVGKAEMVYECFDTGIGNYRNLFTSVVYSGSDVEYSFFCHGSSNLFGCIGLRNKKYCILNKQYSKEEYEALLPKIKEQMMKVPYVDKNGCVYKYGEFFPAEISPFCYNETQAQDYFPLTREEAFRRGYKWRDREASEYNVTLEASDLPDKLENAPESILTETIGCLNKGKSEGCRGAFKLTEGEMNLYKKLGVPLPRFCFFCRHEARLKKRNPMKLWHRSCMCEKNGHEHNGKCPNEFETSYAPPPAGGRSETIYCENCYNKEVY